MSLDLFGALNSQQQGYYNALGQLPYERNLLAPYYEYQAQLQREAFYRSCSTGWLDAMLDVELGL